MLKQIAGLSPEAVALMDRAEAEAKSRGSRYVLLDHLLFAAVTWKGSRVARLLAQMADIDEIAQNRRPSASAVVGLIEPKHYSMSLDIALEDAAKEAKQLGSEQVGPEHIMIGSAQAPTREDFNVIRKLFPVEVMRNLVMREKIAETQVLLRELRIATAATSDVEALQQAIQLAKSRVGDGTDLASGHQVAPASV